MSAPLPNLLSPGETLGFIVRRDGATGFTLGFARDASDAQDRTEFVRCDPDEAQIATVYITTREGLSQAVTDIALTEAGADELAAICAALFRAILDSRQSGDCA